MTQYHCWYVCIENYCNKYLYSKGNFAKTKNICLKWKSHKAPTDCKILNPSKEFWDVHHFYLWNLIRGGLSCDVHSDQTPQYIASDLRLYYYDILTLFFIQGTAEKSTCSIFLKLNKLCHNSEWFFPRFRVIPPKVFSLSCPQNVGKKTFF